MGPHSVGPQVSGNVRCSFSCLGDTSAAAARSPNTSASPAPLCGHKTEFVFVFMQKSRQAPLPVSNRQLCIDLSS